MVAIVTVGEQATETRFTNNQELKAGTRFSWRVRAFDSKASSAWSLAQSFVTPTAAATPPSPVPPAPSGPPAGGWPKTGEEDDTGIPLVLQWGENPNDSLVSPATYFPAPSCK